MSYVMTELQQCITINSIVTIHYFEYASSFCFPGEKHNFWEFVYVDNGEIEVCGGTAVRTLHTGEMIFHQPNEFHSLKANGSIAPNLIVIAFDCSSPAMDYFRGRTLYADDHVRSCLNTIIRETEKVFSSPLNDPYLQKMIKKEHPEFGAEQFISMSLESLLIHLRRNGFAEQPLQQKVSFQTINRSNADDDILEKVTGYFNSHVTDQLAIKMICHDNLVSYSKLKSLFRQHYDCGVLEYFNQTRINAARRMIRDNDLNISEIADKLGYSSVHYFSRQFKQKTGMSPTEYASSVLAMTEVSAGD